MPNPDPPTPTRLRRPPPEFRPVSVVRSERIAPRLVRVTLGGPALAGMPSPEPAASVRVLLPPGPTAALVVPAWNGNEFLLPDGRRPVIRTLTPVRVDTERCELDVDVVLHAGGAASAWAEGAAPGTPAAVSGPGRGYTVAVDAPAYLVAGDETAVPAIRQLLDAVPTGIPTTVHVEIAAPDGASPLPDRADATVAWHVLPVGAPPGDALVAAVASAAVTPGGRLWVAGEATAVQRIRRMLFEERGVPRPLASVRGYWKHGRTGDAGNE